MESKYKAYYKPHDRNYDLHFNIPDDLAEVGRKTEDMPVALILQVGL